ncbi:MAG TPA: UbiA family prenyltransferase, partial [Spirochaetota bacterium]|nr:UbiA family prenyltransferase [Spirochaetota bacterium]
MNLIINILKLLRVKHWIKNLFVFFGLVFSLNLFNFKLAISSALCFISFCLASSFVYIVNDIIDIEKDKKHPVKKLRPIPAGKIKYQIIIFFLVLLFLSSIFIAFFINFN